MNFKEFKTEKNEDGSYNVLSVPIFELGSHKGEKYDDDWFQKTKELHEKQEKADYMPGVIIGHNDGKEEKPVIGFLKNLQLKGKTVLADIVKIAETAFNDIKDRKYPHRSVEIWKGKPGITALALLGGTPPYFKLPILEVAFQEQFHQDGEHDILNFELVGQELQWDTTILEQAKSEEKLSFLRRIWGIVSDRMWQILHSGKDVKDIQEKVGEVLNEGTEAINKEMGKSKVIKNEEEPMDPKVNFTEEQLEQAKKDAAREAETKFREDFKTKHGNYPEDLVQQQKDNAIKARKDGIKAFCEKLKTTVRDGRVLAPAVVDDIIQPFLNGGDTIKFQDKDRSGDEAAQYVIDKIIEFAAEDKLFVEMQETVQHGDNTEIKTQFDDDPSVAPENLILHKKAMKYMEDHPGTSYEIAVMKVIN